MTLTITNRVLVFNMGYPLAEYEIRYSYPSGDIVFTRLSQFDLW